MNRKIRFLVLASIAAAAFLAAHAWSEPRAGEALPRLLPDGLEAELALSAAPEHLRAGAGVHVLQRGGYREHRKAANHYSCLVVRTSPQAPVQSAAALIPICFDEEGMRTYAPVHFDAAMWREQGVAAEQIRERIQAGFASGRYRAPERSGMSFMISPVLNLPDGKGGVLNYPPHFMFYAPQLTNAGQDAMPDHGDGWLPWVNDEGPHGMIIVPVGKAEQEKIQGNRKV